MKIAKPGFDVRTASNKNLVLNSEYPCLVELFSDTVTVTSESSGEINYEFTHNLGYIPEFEFFEKDNSTGRWEPFFRFDVYATTTKLVVISNLDPDTDYTFYYKIYGNRYDNAVGTGNNNVTGKLRIAKSGYNAESETDARNMVFFSGASVPKLDESLSDEISGTTDSGGDLSLEITHNLNYIPEVFILWEEGWSGASVGGTMLPFSFVGLGTPLLYYEISTTKIYIEVLNSDTETEHTFKYKILRDKIE